MRPVFEALAARDLAATLHRFDPRIELVGVEGLDQVVVRTALQAAHTIGDAVARRQHDHRNPAIVAAPARQPFHAVAVGQAEVENDQIVVKVSCHAGQGFLGGAQARPRFRVPAARAPAQQQLTRNDDIVLDQQQTHDCTVRRPTRIATRHARRIDR